MKTLAASPTATDRRATLFHALSDPTRIRILDCLAACEQCVCDLTASLDAAQSRLSFHLRVLKDAGLITDRRSGRWVFYSLAPEALEEAAACIARLRGGVSAEEGVAGPCCS